jgi:hypothetical protein
MRPSSIAIAAIWVLFLADAFRQGWQLPSSELAQLFRFDTFGQWMLALPFAFFVIAAFLQRHKLQFTSPFLTRFINERFGQGAYERFLSRLKPVALFMLACLALGGTGLITTHISNQTPGAYVLSGFFLSAGFGLLVAYLLSMKFPPRLQ